MTRIKIEKIAKGSRFFILFFFSQGVLFVSVYYYRKQYRQFELHLTQNI